MGGKERVIRKLKSKRAHTHTHIFYVRQPLWSCHWLARLFQL